MTAPKTMAATASLDVTGGWQIWGPTYAPKNPFVMWGSCDANGRGVLPVKIPEFRADGGSWAEVRCFLDGESVHGVLLDDGCTVVSEPFVNFAVAGEMANRP